MNIGYDYSNVLISKIVIIRYLNFSIWIIRRYIVKYLW